MKAMEFGCGTGLVTMGLAPTLEQIVAVDTSSKMLDVLEQKIRQDQIGNIIPRQLDLLSDRLPDDRFDLVYTSMALHHIEEIPLLLRVFHRLLNRDGHLAIADLDTEDGGFHGDIPDVFHNGFDRQDLARQLEKAGFSGIKQKTAHVIEKPHAATGEMARFPVFLITGRRS